jgi:hypothetical protein
MERREFLGMLPALALAAQAARVRRRTTVSIQGGSFAINGRPTYAGREYQGMRIEGLLLNARLVQGIFDDLNPETAGRWNYPDTAKWDAERNTSEFIEAMPEWRRHGLLSFTINLQGGSPEGYSKAQPWINSAFRPDGSLRPDYLARLRKILDRADALGMAPIVGYFYGAQVRRLEDEAAVRRAVTGATTWLLEQEYRNVLAEIVNESNQGMRFESLRPAGIDETIRLAQSIDVGRRRLLVGTSYLGGVIPTPNVVRASDFLLMHGNGVKDPERIAQMVAEARRLDGYRPMPVLFNEDDHFDFDRPVNNMVRAIGSYASWGYFDPGQSNYQDGFQCPPVRWSINTPRKKAFFALLKRITGS